MATKPKGKKKPAPKPKEATVQLPSKDATNFEKAANLASLGSSNSGALTQAQIDRLRILQLLEAKRVSLFEAEAKLRLRLRGESSTNRSTLLNAIAQIILEIDRVEARRDAITAAQPFRALPADQETALLAIIREVGRRADTNAAITDLAEAALNLVNTYRAKDTA